MVKPKIVPSLERRVRAALMQADLGNARCLVVAVSGGPDSLALLHALYRLRDELGMRLHAAHLNHELRGSESAADARFVADTCRRLDIGLVVEGADVSSVHRERRISLEEAAREVRYHFLFRVAADLEADAVTVGHTSDDQAETVLMHILRGSGLAGLRGMETVLRRRLDDREVALVRPLLSVSREETIEYCRALGLEPRLDKTNLSLTPKRNWVRLRAIPLLQQYNPAVKDALTRLSRSIAKDLAHMEAEVDRLWRKTVRSDDNGIALDRLSFSRSDPAVQGHLLRKALASLEEGLTDIEQGHIDDMARLMTGSAGRSLDLPRGIRFHVGYSAATLTRRQRNHLSRPALEGEHHLTIPGESLLPEWAVTAEVVSPAESQPLHDRERRLAAEKPGCHAAILDYDSLDGQAWVRSRREGDRFQPLGMPRSKRLQDFMVDSRVPRDMRDRVPLVVSPRGIAWVVGWRIAEWAKVSANQGRLLELQFEPRP